MINERTNIAESLLSNLSYFVETALKCLILANAFSTKWLCLYMAQSISAFFFVLSFLRGMTAFASLISLTLSRNV
ncbi:MAG: hypothetical protein CENE_02471 [Candidatus Celerinatantimonas neptuna]|nr:MAG: hypothetical protein CENE_02471 [Candidatus Celerinatantimonas neptuna]